jgi:hypothetical protein
MSPEEKIAKVLYRIKNEMGISPNSNLVEFRFNNVVGLGSVFYEDEIKILLKLQNENVIKIESMSYGDRDGKASIRILDNFLSCYKKYEKYLYNNESGNYWNYINPLWLLWQVSLLFWKSMQLLWRHKVISSVVAMVISLITLLTSDYSKISENVNKLQIFFK